MTWRAVSARLCIVEEMANDLLETVGLSPNHQIFTIMLLLIVATMVIAFLFLAISSYNNEAGGLLRTSNPPTLNRR